MFKAKIYVDGILDKLKARLVAKGFSQIYGVDFIDTVEVNTYLMWWSKH